MTPEFSRPISASRVGVTPSVHRIEANAEERAALARRFDLVALDRLTAEIWLRRDRTGWVHLDGTLEAVLTQRCVVTLDPVEAMVGDSFTLIYRPDLDEATADQLALDAPDDTVFEPLEGDSIDIGEAVAQQLSVVMDPYPRAAGAAPAIEEGEADAELPARPRNPFEALASLKRTS